MQSFAHVGYYFLAGFVILAALFFTSKDKKRKLAGDALLVLATIFVGISLYHTLFDSNRLAKSTPIIEADKAELSLKLAQAIRASSRIFVSPKIIDRRHSQQPIDQTSTQAELLLHEGQKVLGSLVQSNPNAPVLEGKYALVTHEAGDPNSMSLERLSHIDTENGHKLHRALTILYSPAKPTPSEVVECETTFKALFPQGWYQDTALLELYKKVGMVRAFDDLQAHMDDSALKLLTRILVVMSVMVLAGLAGVIVIIVQLFFLPRRLANSEQLAQIRPPKPIDVKTIYGVFIAWMAWQHLIGNMIQPVFKYLDLLNHGVLAAASATAGLYLLSNGPALIFIYLIAFKPRALPFFDSVKIRIKVPTVPVVQFRDEQVTLEANQPAARAKLTERSNGWALSRLVLCGFLTWFAAIPVVIVTYLIAMKLMNSQGSSNPVIALVMEAARNADLPAVLMFYFTLGVLAPICEETLFRGFLYPCLRQFWGVLPCLVVTGGLFAAVHMDMGGFMPLFALGFLFGFIVERTKSIIPSMIAHGLWNSCTFTLILLLFGK